MSDSPNLQAQDEIINEWISSMMANRLVVKHVDGSIFKIGRINGIKSILVQGETEDEITTAMQAALQDFARQRFALSQPLPRFTAPPPAVAEEVAKCLVHSRVKGLLKARSKSWGAKREKLPPHIMAALLADFDSLLTRHACQIESA